MKIFITNDAYLPGYRFGGPVRSLTNLIEWLAGEYQFFVFTKDRDLGGIEPYPGQIRDQWVSVGKAKVFYASPERHTPRRTLEEINRIRPDVVYLNGLWESMTRGLLASRLDGIRYVLAPRGALGAGALEIKPLKKRLGLWWLKRNWSGVIWHATAQTEQDEIRAIVGEAASIVEAPNLMARASIIEAGSIRASDGTVRLVAFSRLSPKKNFHYLLDRLQSIKSDFILDIIGPEEDIAYVSELKESAASFPAHQQIQFLGGLAPEELKELLPSYDGFVLPTQHENFGHVFVEAWSAGLPVIISDQTPWRNLEAKGVGWDISLREKDKWVCLLNKFITMPLSERKQLRENCLSLAQSLVAGQDFSAYERLFGATKMEHSR